MPKLIRRDTEEAFDLAEGQTVIGRSSHSDIQVLGKQISRTHCKIEGPAGGWTLTDCGSKLGTFVNGKRVQQHRLEQDDEIKVGPALLVFDDTPAAAASEPEARPRRSALRLVPAAIAAAVGVGAVAALVALVVTTRRTPARVVRDAAERLRRRDAKGLWALLSRERQQQITFEEFAEQVALVKPAVLDALRTLEVAGERRADVGVVVPVAVELDGTRIADEVVLYREDGDWRIHTVPLGRIKDLTP